MPEKFLSLPRAKQAFQKVPTNDGALQSIIDASCECIEKYLSRILIADDYDEIYSSFGDGVHILKQFPIGTLTRFSHTPLPVMWARFTNTTLGYRGTVEVKSDRLLLFDTLNGTTPIKFADCPTLGDVITAICAVPSWTSNTNYSAMDSWEIGIFPGVMNAKVNAPLKAFTLDAFHTEFNAETGEVYADIPKGFRNCRIVYRGGFEKGYVPEPIIEATAELVKETWENKEFKQRLASMTLETFSYAKAATTTFDMLGLVAKYGLSLYKDRRPSAFREGGQRL